MTGNFLFSIGTFLSLTGRFRFWTAISMLVQRKVEVTDSNIAMDNRNIAVANRKILFADLHTGIR
ncbi:MAG: hypothetical protein LBD59_06415 [Prevotellaceae bacterium]|nr:hypothetical protein [Prevotellaceae bacterium]